MTTLTRQGQGSAERRSFLPVSIFSDVHASVHPIRSTWAEGRVPLDRRAGLFCVLGARHARRSEGNRVEKKSIYPVRVSWGTIHESMTPPGRCRRRDMATTTSDILCLCPGLWRTYVSSSARQFPSLRQRVTCGWLGVVAPAPVPVRHVAGRRGESAHGLCSLHARSGQSKAPFCRKQLTR